MSILLKRGTAACYGVIVVAALAVFAFFQWCYPYHFFFQEQNQLFLLSWEYISTYMDQRGGLSFLIGDFLTQFYYYLYAGTAILSAVIMLIGLLVYDALRRMTSLKSVSLIVSLLLMGLVAVFHFSVYYRLSSTIAMLAWVFLLWMVSLLKHWKYRIILLATAALPVWLLFGAPKNMKVSGPDMILEKSFAADNEYYFGNHQRVIDMVEQAGDEVTIEQEFFYYLVQAQRGELPDHLMRFRPAELGTFYRIGPETPRLVINNMNELYWALGDMTFTERAAMMNNVFSPQNRNVRMIRRLAECNIVSGDTLAAEKYLKLLDKTLVYRQWSQRARNNPAYRQKAAFANHRDTITVSDNAHFLMLQLLRENPNNIVALDYMLCSMLLLKDISGFKRDYDNFCIATGRPRHKRLYQEALCIWLAGTEASPEEWAQYISDSQVLKRFQEYNLNRGSKQYADTYWYYFDKIKAPEVK